MRPPACTAGVVAPVWPVDKCLTAPKSVDNFLKAAFCGCFLDSRQAVFYVSGGVVDRGVL